MLEAIHISTECLLMIISSKALDPVIPVLASVVAETNSIIILSVNDLLFELIQDTCSLALFFTDSASGMAAFIFKCPEHKNCQLNYVCPGC